MPVLVIANKQDLPTSKKDKEIESKIGVNEFSSTHPTLTLSCCAVTGEGLDEIFDALYDLIQQSRKNEKVKRKMSH